MIKFETIDGRTIEINASTIYAYEYRISQKDGSVALKYHNVPEFTIRTWPEEYNTIDLLEIVVDIFDDLDGYGKPALIEEFIRQQGIIERNFASKTNNYLRMKIKDVGPCGKQGWYGSGRTFSATVQNAKPGWENYRTYVDNFDYKFFLSLMENSVVENMPNLPWFGPPSSNPHTQSWNIIGGFKTRILEVKVPVTKSSKKKVVKKEENAQKAV